MAASKINQECSDRSVYRITYSQADTSKIESREEFAKLFIDAFGEEVIDQWACGCEKHKSGGLHFHLALKLKKMRRWKKIKESITEKHGIVVNFQSFHTNYYDAYQYVTKEDLDYQTSEGHPMMANSPQTKFASRKRKSLKDAEPSVRTAVPLKQKRQSLGIIKVYDIITTNNIRNERDLFCLALQQKEEGKTDLMTYVLTISDKRRGEIVKTAWRMNNASVNRERSNKTRLQLLEEAENTECSCAGQWAEKAVETLRSNSIDPDVFRDCVKNALEHGRKKGNNLMLIGPANCGKTFLLKPLTKIFKCFVSPASGTFAWVGAEKAEAVFLNDLRWSEKLLPWADFLNLLEGLPIHVPAPKTHFAEDLLWIEKTPIFATSSRRLRKYDGGVLNDVETAMMEVRWRYFEFSKPVQSPEEINSCAQCFATFILQ